MTLTERDVERLLARIRQFVADGRIRFTNKALDELDDLELNESDCLDVISKLEASDYSKRVGSRSSDEWMHVFAPTILWTRLYVKLILRTDCVVISFHDEDEPDAQETD